MNEDWRNELVTKGAAVDALKDNMFRLTLAEEQRCEGHVVWDEDVVFADVLEKALLALPSAQPQRIKGRWIDVTKTGGAELWKCSECGELELEDSYFCPCCGADMRGEDDGNE